MHRLLPFPKKKNWKKKGYPRPSTLDPRPSTWNPRPRPGTLDPRPSTLDPRQKDRLTSTPIALKTKEIKTATMMTQLGITKSNVPMSTSLSFTF